MLNIIGESLLIATGMTRPVEPVREERPVAREERAVGRFRTALHRLVGNRL